MGYKMLAGKALKLRAEKQSLLAHTDSVLKIKELVFCKIINFIQLLVKIKQYYKLFKFCNINKLQESPLQLYISFNTRNCIEDHG
jgi:hypothetical protein